VARSHPRCWHPHRVGCHVGHGTLHVVVLGRGWGILVQGTEFVFFGFEVVVGVVTYFAIGARFVGAAMPVIRSVVWSEEGKEWSLLGEVV